MQWYIVKSNGGAGGKLSIERLYTGGMPATCSWGTAVGQYKTPSGAGSNHNGGGDLLEEKGYVHSQPCLFCCRMGWYIKPHDRLDLVSCKRLEVNQGKCWGARGSMPHNGWVRFYLTSPMTRNECGGNYCYLGFALCSCLECWAQVNSWQEGRSF